MSGHESTVSRQPIEQMFDLETVNKIKIDANKFDYALRGDSGFIGLIEKGLVVVTGEKNGELIYGVTAAGDASIEESNKDGSFEQAQRELSEKGGVRL